MEGRKIGPFNHIFTSEDKPDAFPEGFRPPDGGFIAFTLNPKQATYEDLKQIGLLRLGRVIERPNQEVLLTITEDSYSKNPAAMIAAIAILKDKFPAQTPEQKKFYAQLTQFQAKCIAQQPKGKRPPKSRPISTYKIDEGDKKGIAASVNATALATKKTKQGKPSEKSSVLKKNTLVIADIEVFNAFCYKAELGDQHPKVRAVHDEANMRAGVVSKKENFTSFYDISVVNHGLIDRQQLLTLFVAYILVAAYVNSENDLHAGNYGKDKSIELSLKIDDDQASWEISSEFATTLPAGYPDPVAAFPITERDILNFPQLTDAVPFHWIDRGVPVFDIFAAKNPEQVVIDKAKKIYKIDEAFIKDKEFNKQKYTMFLKCILMPDEAYRAYGQAAFSDEDAMLRDTMVALKTTRTELLKQTLLKMPEFRDFIRDNPQAIEKIITEFEENNGSYKEKDASLRVDVAKVRATYDQEIVPALSKVQDRKPAPEKSKVQTTQATTREVGLFANKQTKPSLDIDNILNNLGKNLLFFIAPLQNKTVFVAWTKNLKGTDRTDYVDCAKKLNEALKGITDGAMLFNSALSSLLKNNDKPMRSLLATHPALGAQLQSYMQKSITSKWYDDNKIQQQQRAPAPPLVK